MCNRPWGFSNGSHPGEGYRAHAKLDSCIHTAWAWNPPVHLARQGRLRSQPHWQLGSAGGSLTQQEPPPGVVTKPPPRSTCSYRYVLSHVNCSTKHCIASPYLPRDSSPPPHGYATKIQRAKGYVRPRGVDRSNSRQCAQVKAGCCGLTTKILTNREAGGRGRLIRSLPIGHWPRSA